MYTEILSQQYTSQLEKQSSVLWEKTYKFKSECLFDAESFARKFNYNLNMDTEFIEENFEAVFYSFYDIDVIRKQMASIPDAYVMISTLNKICDYTGECYFSPEKLIMEVEKNKQQEERKPVEKKNQKAEKKPIVEPKIEQEGKRKTKMISMNDVEKFMKESEKKPVRKIAKKTVSKKIKVAVEKIIPEQDVLYNNEELDICSCKKHLSKNWDIIKCRKVSCTEFECHECVNMTKEKKLPAAKRVKSESKQEKKSVPKLLKSGSKRKLEIESDSESEIEIEIESDSDIDEIADSMPGLILDDSL